MRITSTSVASWKYDGYSCRNKASAKREQHNYGCGYSIGWHIVLPRHEYSFSLNYKLWNVTRNMRAYARRLRQTAGENFATNIRFKMPRNCATQFAKLPRYLSILNNLRFFVQLCINAIYIRILSNTWNDKNISAKLVLDKNCITKRTQAN